MLHFALLGGANSRLYLYINQTQTLELAARGFYRKHLRAHSKAYLPGLPIDGFNNASSPAESR